MTASNQPVEQGNDPAGDMLVAVVVAALWAVAVLVCAPLLIPLLVRSLAGRWAPVKRWYWLTYRWWWILVTAGIVAVLALLATEVGLIVTWAQAGGFDALRAAEAPAMQAWSTIWPWLVVNFAAGVLLVPAVWSYQRRKVAAQVRLRTIPDVVRQERIETAQRQARDLSSARRIGVRVDAVTRTITGSDAATLTAPHRLADNSYALGVINQETIRGIAQRMADQSRVPDWVTSDMRHLVLPSKVGACRAMLFAESGTGKTVLLMSIITAAMKLGWKVIFIDAKGVPKDARELARLVEMHGGTAVISGAGEAAQTQWNLFHGDAADITAKIMRLQPPPAGANQHYLDEIESVLDIIQTKAPLTSVDDLQERIENLDAWVEDRRDWGTLRNIVDSKTSLTAAERATAAVVKSLRRFREWTDPEGWTFDAPLADVTIFPLIPVDRTQAALGDLLLLELRSYIKRRLEREDYTPVLMVVDEFPQLVAPGNDPADLATKLFETLRSAGGGLILAAQAVEGMSPDAAMRSRALSSGAAVLFGRQKNPDELCSLAGTEMRLEASGAASGDELRSGRAQHTFRIKPDDVRRAAAGEFWIVQGGHHATFRALPNASADVSATPTHANNAH